jgi:hypothetical protein
MSLFSKGTVYRTGMRIKDFGERVVHIKIFGCFVFHRLSGWIVGKGLKMKDSVLGCPISELK